MPADGMKEGQQPKDTGKKKDLAGIFSGKTPVSEILKIKPSEERKTYAELHDAVVASADLDMEMAKTAREEQKKEMARIDALARQEGLDKLLKKGILEAVMKLSETDREDRSKVADVIESAVIKADSGLVQRIGTDETKYNKARELPGWMAVHGIRLAEEIRLEDGGINTQDFIPEGVPVLSSEGVLRLASEMNKLGLGRLSGDDLNRVAEAFVAGMAGGAIDDALQAVREMVKGKDGAESSTNDSSSEEQKTKKEHRKDEPKEDTKKKDKEKEPVFILWKDISDVLEKHADRVAQGKITSLKDQEKVNAAVVARDRLIQRAKDKNILNDSLKTKIATAMDEIISDYPINMESGRNEDPRVLISDRLRVLIVEPRDELNGIMQSYIDGILREIDIRVIEGQIASRRSLKMGDNPAFERERNELQARIGVLNWGGLSEATKNRLQRLSGTCVDWLQQLGPEKDDYLIARKNQTPLPVNGQSDMLKGWFGSGHTLESYERTGDTRGIFNDEPGHGLYRIFHDPVVTRKAENPMEPSGTWDMFIELNKFSQGRGDIALWGKLLEYALPGEDNEGNRWGMLEMAKFMNAVYNISKSADYKKLIDKEKGLLNGIDPRAIAIIIKQVPEMSNAFAYYWEKFRDPSLIATAQDIITEVDLRGEDTTKAAEWECSEGIIRATRHWVTEFGVFPFTQSETRKMVNRYPGMFLEPNGTLVPGIGFSLVEIQGERKGSIMDRALNEGNYEEFLRIYSDTSYAGNTDPLWSIKMWGGVDTIHDFIANTYKHALKTMSGDVNMAASLSGISPAGFEHLVSQGFLTKKPVKIPSFGEFVSTIKGSRALLVSNVTFMLGYLFNLEPVNPNIPTGPVRSKNHIFLIGNHENEIVQALGKCLIKSQKGLDGPVNK